MGDASRFVAPSRKIDKDEHIVIVILAAGAGYRVRYYGAKSLIQLNSKENIVQRQVRIIKSIFRYPDIVVVGGFQADKVVASINNIRFVENERYEETGVSRSLALGLRVTNVNKLLIIYGDLIFNDATLSFDTSKSCVVVDKSGQIKDKEVGVNIQDDYVHHFGYSISPKWGQIALLRDMELEILKNTIFNRDNDNMFGHELLNEILKKGGSLVAQSPNNMSIQEIDTAKDIKEIYENSGNYSV